MVRCRALRPRRRCKPAPAETDPVPLNQERLAARDARFGATGDIFWHPMSIGSGAGRRDDDDP
jgi:hypothetical protein